MKPHSSIIIVYAVSLLNIGLGAESLDDAFPVNVGWIKSVTGGAAWLKRSDRSDPVALSPTNGRGSPVYRSSSIRCEPGTEVTVQLLWGKGAITVSSTNWHSFQAVEIPKVPGAPTNLGAAGTYASGHMDTDAFDALRSYAQSLQEREMALDDREKKLLAREADLDRKERELIRSRPPVWERYALWTTIAVVAIAALVYLAGKSKRKVI